MAQAQDDHAQAFAWFAEGLGLATELGDIVNDGYFIKGIAQAAGPFEEFDAAMRLIGAARAALEATGSPPNRYVDTDALETDHIAAAYAELGEGTAREALQGGRLLPLETASHEALALARVLSAPA